MKLEEGTYYLLSLKGWFVCPTGYKKSAVWGKLTKIRTSDYLLTIGEGVKSVQISAVDVYAAMPVTDRPIELEGMCHDKERDYKSERNEIYFTE